MIDSESPLVRSILRLCGKVAGKRKKGSSSARVAAEHLEGRIAPATFSAVGSALSINLDSINELITFTTDGTTISAGLINGTATDGGGTGGHILGFGSGMVTIDSASFTSVSITDSAAGEGVAFGPYLGLNIAPENNHYPQAFSISLSNAASGNLTFTGPSVFTASFSATLAGGFVGSDPGSLLMLTGSGTNLSLSDSGHDILLMGSVSVEGTTSLTAKTIQADNPANVLTGALSLTGTGVASIFNSTDLTLGTSTFTLGSPTDTVQINAAGSITQVPASTLTTTGGSGSGTISFISTGGSINLSNTGNAMPSPAVLALSVTGANTASLYNKGATVLGNITAGTGLVSLTSTGSLSQAADTTIQAHGGLSLTTDLNTNLNIILGNHGNVITGAVTVTETNGGDLRDFTLRNADENAMLPTGSPFTTANDIRNLTLFFDNNAVALPGYSISGSLNVTAGGDITQTAALTIGGNSFFTILGDYKADLTNAGNVFTGSVAFSAIESAQPISVTDSNALQLAASTLGRGAFSATAVSGNITESGAITQEKGASAATFTVTGGGTINLGSSGNDFAGSLVFVGGSLNTVSVRNADPMAKYTDLTLPGTLTDLTVTFDNAGVVLPSLNLTNLSVTGQGIIQATGASLVISNNASFDSKSYPMDLSHPANNFTNLTINNTGHNDVLVTDVNDLAFVGTSTLGNGHLTILVGGNLTETGAGAKIVQSGAGPASAVSITSTGGSINLPNANKFIGTLSTSVSGTNNDTINNNNLVLTLGQVTVGTGTFAASAGNQTITQDPNSVLSLSGPSSFTTTGSVNLNNHTNTFGGAVSLSASNASLVATGAVVLGTSTVSGNLSITTGGKASDSITQTGTITSGSTASFNSGLGNVILTANNDFNTVSVTSTGTTVSINDVNALKVGTIQVGGGSLTLTAGGSLSEGASGSLVQTTGTGPITLTTPAGSNITLNTAGNHLLGPVTVTGSNNVNIATLGDLTFAGASVINGNLTATAGGTLTLPTTINVGTLTLSAKTMTIGSDLTASGAVSLSGDVHFTGARTVNAGGIVTLNGDVDATGALVFNLPNGSNLQFQNGNWNQGTNPLTINGTNVSFTIGDGVSPHSNFIMSTGTISMPGNGSLTVASPDGNFQVGTDPVNPEVVTLANGSGNVFINGNYSVGFGALPDTLVKTGSGYIQLGTNSHLVGSGLAPAAFAPVLVTQTSVIAGHFANSVDTSGNPVDFFAGSDIVTPLYAIPQASIGIKAGGVAASSGTATGFLPDGDKFTVTSSLGASAGLVTVVDPTGSLEVVTRNASSSASTLTIACTFGGDGRLSIGGLAINSTGAATVKAATSDFHGMLWTAGTLASLTAGNLGNGSLGGFVLTDGGPATGATSIAAAMVHAPLINLAGPLKTYTAVESIGGIITAASFGTLKTTGNALAAIPGAFNSDLVTTSATPGVAVNTANIAGTLGGTWDIAGSVGMVTAKATSGWALGTVSGANIANGDMLTTATKLNVGVVDTTSIHATGAVTTISAVSMATSNLAAGSFGTITLTGNASTGDRGNFSSSTLMATGNAKGVALGTLKIAGSLTGSSIELLNGNATTITVGTMVSSSSVNVVTNGSLGNIGTITAAGWQATNVDARTIGTFRIISNLATGLLGDFSGSTVMLQGTAGAALGTFSTVGNVSSSIFTIESGNLGTFSVGRQLGSTTVQLLDPAFGQITTISAGDWTSGDVVLAKTIGTLKSNGAAAALPASPLLLGGMVSDTITTYLNSGTVPSIGTFTLAGDLNGSSVFAERGITAMTIKRSVTNSFVVADDAVAGAAAVGKIGMLTAGAWSSSILSATTLGTLKITGDTQLENLVSTLQLGDITSGTILIHGSTATKTGPGPGTGTISVQHSIQTNSFIAAPFGITTLTVAGSIASGSKIVTDNLATPASGLIGTLIAGDMQNATVRAGDIGTLKVVGSIPFGLLGTIANSSIAVDSSTSKGVALGTFSVTGDVLDSVLDVPGNVTSMTVTGRIATVATGTRIEAAYAAGSKLGTISAGAWGMPGATAQTALVSQAIGTFKLVGNTARQFVGSMDDGLIDILGAASGTGSIALGTYSGTGTITDSLFRISAGNVTSFTALRLVSSDLLVGFRLPKLDDIAAAPTAANWSATNYKIGTFKTTALFDPTDAADSASFVDSNVVAAILGTISISGVNPATLDATAFGVAFRASGGAAGAVTVAGSTLAPGAVNGQFEYLGLAG